MKEQYENTGCILRKIRLHRDKIQKELCEATNISQPCYSRLESGKADPHLSQITAIAGFYGIEPYLLVAMICDGNIEALEGRVK